MTLSFGSFDIRRSSRGITGVAWAQPWIRVDRAMPDAIRMWHAAGTARLTYLCKSRRGLASLKGSKTVAVGAAHGFADPDARFDPEGVA